VPSAARILPVLVAATVIACPVFLLGLYVDSMPVRLAAKPWIHLALAGWIRAAGTGAYARRIAAGILLCMVADVLLEFRQTAFVYGMAVFLTGQLVFASAFRMREASARPLVALPFLVWLGAAFTAIEPGLGALRVPVMAYMAAIGTMMWRAAAWFAASPASGRDALPARLALAGAVVFGASDTVIALDRFGAPVAGARYVIILTYWAALSLIAASAVRADTRDGGSEGWSGGRSDG
jgi:alkenylglycerophosphocholine/alkenylglycerophosphoethanolamine hydrolase